MLENHPNGHIYPWGTTIHVKTWQPKPLIILYITLCIAAPSLEPLTDLGVRVRAGIPLWWRRTRSRPHWTAKSSISLHNEYHPTNHLSKSNRIMFHQQWSSFLWFSYLWHHGWITFHLKPMKLSLEICSNCVLGHVLVFLAFF